MCLIFQIKSRPWACVRLRYLGIGHKIPNFILKWIFFTIFCKSLFRFTRFAPKFGTHMPMKVANNMTKNFYFIFLDGEGVYATLIWVYRFPQNFTEYLEIRAFKKELDRCIVYFHWAAKFQIVIRKTHRVTSKRTIFPHLRGTSLSIQYGWLKREPWYIPRYIRYNACSSTRDRGCTSRCVIIQSSPLLTARKGHTPSWRVVPVLQNCPVATAIHPCFIFPDDNR